MPPLEALRTIIERSARAAWWSDSRSELLEGYIMRIGGVERARVEEALRFVEQYVRAVPDLLERLSSAAGEAGLASDLAPLVEVIVGYWELEDDHLPDRLGLLGLADDAYFSFRLLERFVGEYRELADQDLFPNNLAQANGAMERLLGEETAGRLDEEVTAAFARVELRRSLEGLARWRGALGVEGALPAGEALPAVPMVSRAAEVERAVAEAGEDRDAERFGPWAVRRGNLSLLALGGAVGLLFAWQLYFRFPMSAEVRIFGFDGIKLAWLSSLQTFIFGSLGLSTLLAAANLKNLIGNFYRPFEELRGAELKSFYASRGTLVFALAVFMLFAVVCVSNVTVRLGVEPRDLDLVVHVDGGRDAFFVTYPAGGEAQAPEISDEVRLGGPEEVRLVLRGLDAEALLLVRDRYNLRTIDALSMRRETASVAYTKSYLVAPIPDSLSSPEKTLLASSPTEQHLARSFAATRFTLDLQEPFRYSRMVPNRIVGESGAEYGPKGEHHLYIVPADSSPCPDQAPLRSSEIQLFWDEICARRTTLAGWARRSSFFDVPKVGMAAVDLPNHRVEVLFTRGEVAGVGDRPPRRTREAVRLVAIHRKWLEKDLRAEEPSASEAGAAVETGPDPARNESTADGEGAG